VALRIAEQAALSDVGRARQSNEDSYLERAPLFVVADGMGGARSGRSPTCRWTRSRSPRAPATST
jgi:hypothetical protein